MTPEELCAALLLLNFKAKQLSKSLSYIAPDMSIIVRVRNVYPPLYDVRVTYIDKIDRIWKDFKGSPSEVFNFIKEKLV